MYVAVASGRKPTRPDGKVFFVDRTRAELEVANDGGGDTKALCEGLDQVSL